MTVPRARRTSTRALWSLLREGPRVADAALVRRRLGRRGRPDAHARPRVLARARCSAAASSWPRRRRRGQRRRDGAALLRPRVPRRARAPRSCPSPSSSRPSTTGSRTGATVGDRAQLPALLRRHHARRGPRRGPRGVRRRRTRCSSRSTATARSTASASTTRTAWPTPAATSSGSPTTTGDAWVVVEKILEGEERLPDAWRCAGTTGYDALLRVQQVLTSAGGRPAARPALGRASRPSGPTLDDVVPESQAARRRRRAGRRGRPADAARCAGSSRTPRPRGLRRGPRGAARLDGPLPRLPRPGPRASTPSSAAVLDDAAGRARDLARAERPRRPRARRAGGPGPAQVPEAVLDAGRVGDDFWSGSSRPAVRSWPRASRTPRSTAGSVSPAPTRSAATPSRSSIGAEEFHAFAPRQLADVAARR